MTADTLMLLGLALAFIGGFAGMFEWLERREKRANRRHQRLIERICWPYPPPAQPRAFNRYDKARYARPPKSTEMLPWR